jgi:hypothetical protein
LFSFRGEAIVAAGDDKLYKKANGYHPQWGTFPTLEQAKRFMDAYADYPGLNYNWKTGPIFYVFAECKKPAIYSNW